LKYPGRRRRLGDSDGVTTVANDGTCNKGEWAVGGGDEDDAETDTDKIAVGIREGEEEEEEIINGDSFEGLSSTVPTWFGSREVYAEAVGRNLKIDVLKLNEISGVQERIWIAPKRMPLELMIQ
jgi:hypothetical protein